MAKTSKAPVCKFHKEFFGRAWSCEDARGLCDGWMVHWTSSGGYESWWVQNEHNRDDTRPVDSLQHGKDIIARESGCRRPAPRKKR